MITGSDAQYVEIGRAFHQMTDIIREQEVSPHKALELAQHINALHPGSRELIQDFLGALVSATLCSPHQPKTKEIAVKYLERVESIAEHLAFLVVSNARKDNTQNRQTAHKHNVELIDIKDHATKTAKLIDEFAGAASKWRFNTPMEE